MYPLSAPDPWTSNSAIAFDEWGSLRFPAHTGPDLAMEWMWRLSCQRLCGCRTRSGANLVCRVLELEAEQRTLPNASLACCVL